MFGRDPKLPIDLDVPLDPAKAEPIADFKGDLLGRMKDAVATVRANQEKYKAQAKEYYDSSRAPNDFRLAQLVLLKHTAIAPGNTKKLSKRWKGPYRIIDIPSEQNIRIVNTNNPKDSQLVHVSRIKPYYNPPEDTLIINADDDIFEIEAIIDHKFENNKDYYLVRRKGHTARHDTWIAADDLDAPEAIAGFHRSLPATSFKPGS